MLKITDSKAQSPVPGLEVPCFRLIPCFLPLKIVREIIWFFSSFNSEEIASCDDWNGEFGGEDFHDFFFLLLLGILQLVWL